MTSGIVVGIATTIVVVVLVVVVLVEVLVGDPVVVVTAFVVSAASSSPPEQATASSAADTSTLVVHAVRFTVPSTMRCALRAVDGCRTTGEGRPDDRCRPHHSSVARSTSVP
jgi:hypothetical protein